MTAIAACIILTVLILGVIGLVSAIRDEIAEDLRRQRMAAEVARATSRLRRLEHDALRQMHDVTSPFLDIDGGDR